MHIVFYHNRNADKTSKHVLDIRHTTVGSIDGYLLYNTGIN